MCRWGSVLRLQRRQADEGMKAVTSYPITFAMRALQRTSIPSSGPMTTLPFPSFPQEESWNKLTGLFCINFLQQFRKSVPFELLKYPVEFLGEVTGLTQLHSRTLNNSKFILALLFYLLSWRGKVVGMGVLMSVSLPSTGADWIGCFLLPLPSHARFPTYF